jgi:phage shock protein A
MSTIVKSKMNRILDKAEDPRETLDYAYEKQMEMLRNVKRGVVEMVTTKRRLQLQAAKVQESITTLENQARQALGAGREDLARLALQRKQAALIELDGLDQQVANLELEQEKLAIAEKRLQAQVRIGAALSGISEEMGDVSLSIERAETKTEQLRARAGAIDELAAAGVLEDFTGREDDIGRQLAQLTAAQNVDDELGALKAGLPSGEKKALSEGNQQ